MKITNVNVYGLEQSIAASRYPMTVNPIFMDNEVALKEAAKQQYKIAAKQIPIIDCRLPNTL